MGVRVRYERKSWWIFVHHCGHRWKKRIGPDESVAKDVAREMRRRLATGEFDRGKPVPEDSMPFAAFAAQWLRTEVELPIARGLADHLAKGTESVYQLQVKIHLVPSLGAMDVRAIEARDVQALHDHFLEIGRPRSAKSIEMALAVLRQILSHARAQGLVRHNAVEEWRGMRRRGRRRGTATARVDASKVLSADEVSRLLGVLADDSPRYAPLALFLADTGARFGEAAALRWADVNLDGATARIARSYSSGKHEGPTKTGRERVVELSTRAREVLAARRPEIVSDEALVFPNRAGSFLLDVYFRTKVFFPAVRKALGAHRHVTPHCLRHTWASLHMARGTPLKWIQEQGGWTTAKMLLDTYGHFMPTENRGFADALTAPNAPQAHPTAIVVPDHVAESAAMSVGYAVSRPFDRPEVADHALHGAAALLQELGDVDRDGCRAALAQLPLQAVGDAGGQEEEGLAHGAALTARRVGVGVCRIVRGVLVGDLDQVLAEGLAQSLPAFGCDRGSPSEQVFALRAERTECGVAVVVRFEHQLDTQHRTRRDQRGQVRADARVGAEAVDPLPRRDSQARHEALILEASVRQQVHGAGREEISFALETQVLRNRGGAKARCAHDAVVVGALAGTRRDQVREMKELLEARLLGVERKQEARVGGIHQSGLSGVRRHDDDAQVVIPQRVAQAVPLRDGAIAIDAAPRAEPRARVRIGAALHREVGRIAHQHGATPVAHGRGIPGGKDAASKPPAYSRCDCGAVQ